MQRKIGVFCLLLFAAYTSLLSGAVLAEQKTLKVYSTEQSMCWEPTSRAVEYAPKPTIADVRREMHCPPGYVSEIRSRSADECTYCRTGGQRCKGFVLSVCELKVTSSSVNQGLFNALSKAEEDKAKRSAIALGQNGSVGFFESLEKAGQLSQDSRVRKACEEDLFRYWDNSSGSCRALTRAADTNGIFGTTYNSGGSGVHVFQFQAPKDGRVLTVSWNFRDVPDRLVVFFNRRHKVLDTGIVSGSGSKSLPGYYGRDGLTILLTGGRDGTAWSFQLQ